MAEHSRPDDLDQLRALVMDQQADIAAQRTRIAHLERHRRVPRRALPLLLAALLVALIPLATLAATPFNDLTGGPHDGNIDAIYTAGITKGCDPPAYVSYCPTANVTREEMASFLARTAGLGGNPPVANAKTAQTADTATNATNAGNANTVGGYAPRGLARAALVTRATPQAVTTGLQPYLTLTIDAPAAGFVVLAGTVTVRSNGRANATDDAREYALLRADIRHLQSGGPTADAPAAMLRQVNGGQLAVPVAHAFPVAAGRQTFALRVAVFGDTEIPEPTCNPICAFDTVSGTLTAQYVPFGYDGGTGLAPTP